MSEAPYEPGPLGTRPAQTTDANTLQSQRPQGERSNLSGMANKFDPVVDAKGDLVAGSADNVASRVPVGVDGSVLVADSTAEAGVGWSLDALSGTYAVGPTPNGTDDTAALQAAINSAITAGTKLALHPGVYKATTLNIDGVLTIEGAGADLTTIKALAGTTTRLINYSSATRREHNKLRHLTIDCTDAMTVQALRVHQQSRMIIHDVLIRGGAVGLYIETSSGSKFDNMIFRSQATSSLQIQGDGGLEFYFEKIDIRNDNPALTPSTGFEVIRTTATDVGGLYLDGVKITKGTGGAITNGIKIACSSGVAAMPTFMTQCVSDLVLGGAAVVLQNVSSFYLSLCYFSTDSTNASPALYIDGANTIQITNSFTYALNGSAPGSIQFVNAPSKLLLIGVRCPGGTFLHLPASLPPVEMVMESCQLSDTVAVANDMGRLVSALGVGGRQNISGPHRVLVATGGGPDQWFVLREPGGNQKGFRVSGGGTLQVMNNAGSVSVLNVTDTGNLQLPVSGAYIEYQTGQRDLAGSGTPEGVVTAPVGSTYRRTNGGAGTSFYVKESGTGNTGWVAK